MVSGSVQRDNPRALDICQLRYLIYHIRYLIRYLICYIRYLIYDIRCHILYKISDILYHISYLTE